MASAKLAPILQDLIGSINGDTFSHTRAVLVCKAKSFPGSAHPFVPSQLQLDRRTQFGTQSGRWKTLTPGQIEAWCNLAELYPSQNKFHESYCQAGFNLFCQLQHNMQLISGTPYDDAPPSLVCESVHAFNLVLTPGVPIVFLLDFSGRTTDADTIHLIYATPPTSVGRFYVKTLYRLIGTLPENTNDTYDASTDYLNYFSSPAVNERVHFKLIPVNRITGYPTTPVYSNEVLMS